MIMLATVHSEYKLPCFLSATNPVCVELVHLTQIYHPKDHPETVWIEYYRVLANSAAIQVCDRANTNFQRFLSSDGTTISTVPAQAPNSLKSRGLSESSKENLSCTTGEMYFVLQMLPVWLGGYWLTREKGSPTTNAKPTC